MSRKNYKLIFYVSILLIDLHVKKGCRKMFLIAIYRFLFPFQTQSYLQESLLLI